MKTSKKSSVTTSSIKPGDVLYYVCPDCRLEFSKTAPASFIPGSPDLGTADCVLCGRGSPLTQSKRFPKTS
jgi:hypothetical protein